MVLFRLPVHNTLNNKGRFNGVKYTTIGCMYVRTSLVRTSCALDLLRVTITKKKIAFESRPNNRLQVLGLASEPVCVACKT